MSNENKIDDGGPANCATLRDYFASSALTGMLASGHQEAIETVWISTTGTSVCDGLALAAYGFADAMIAARNV